MRRAWAFGGLFVTTAACAGLLGIEEVAYSPEGGGSSEAGADGAALDAASDSPSDSGTCSADLTRDPEHCGSCGHSCGAGVTCSDGICAPELVVSGITSPNGLARIAGATYVGGNAGVFRCTSATCGDAGEPLFLADVGANELVTSFSVDDAGMSVSILTLSGAAGIPPGRVVDCPLGPCTAPRQLAPPDQNVQKVVRSEVDVLWGRDGVLAEELVSCPGAQCDAGGVLLGTNNSGLDSVSGIAPVGSSILWMIGSRLYETKRNDGGTALRAAIGASAGVNLPLVRDGDSVFWGNTDARIIEQCDLAAACASSRAAFASVGGTTRALAIDGAFLYMAVDLPTTDAGSSGFVGRARRADGTKVEKLARVKTALRALVVDASHVYWADDDGAVWRVKK